MKRVIYCTFLKRNSEGQDFQIYPGKLGKRIYDTISKEAWACWKSKQTIIINEKKLNTADTSSRELLEREMIDFLFKN